jgi:hypothetical protein
VTNMRAQPIPRPDPPRRRSAALLFTAMPLIYLTTAGGSLSSTDALITFQLTRSLVDARSIALLCWAGAILGWLTSHEFVLAAITGAAWVPLESRQDRALLFRRLVPLAPGGFAWAFYNARRFRNPLDVGYPPSFGAAGFYGLLFSPGESLFLYNPIVLAGLIGLVRLAATDCNSAGATLLVIVASGRQSVRTGSVS